MKPVKNFSLIMISFFCLLANSAKAQIFSSEMKVDSCTRAGNPVNTVAQTCGSKANQVQCQGVKGIWTVKCTGDCKHQNPKYTGGKGCKWRPNENKCVPNAEAPDQAKNLCETGDVTEPDAPEAGPDACRPKVPNFSLNGGTVSCQNKAEGDSCGKMKITCPCEKGSSRYPQPCGDAGSTEIPGKCRRGAYGGILLCEADGPGTWRNLAETFCGSRSCPAN
jgi:hypothetical protein